MTHTYTYGQAVVSVTKRDYTSLVVILLPFQLLPSEMETLASDYQCNVAVLSGMQWDDDLTPWPATLEGNPRMFKGFGERFLESLNSTFLPKIERIIGHPSTHRTLIGNSLGGLFAVWQLTKSDIFDQVASISGSFWYPDFVNYLKENASTIKARKAYLSLGEKEAESSHTIYGDIMAATSEVQQVLQHAGMETVLQLTSGGHTAPVYPRIEKAMDYLCNPVETPA